MDAFSYIYTNSTSEEEGSIFHDADSGILFATFKYVGYDYAGDMERMRENPKVREWWAMTDGFQEVRGRLPVKLTGCFLANASPL